MLHRQCCRKVPVAIQMLLVSTRRPSGLPLAIVMDAVHLSPSMSGASSLHFVATCRWSLALRMSRCFCRDAMAMPDLVISSRSAMRAASLRSCSGCDSSPAPLPTSSKTAIASLGCIAVVSVHWIGGAPSAASANLERARTPDGVSHP